MLLKVILFGLVIYYVFKTVGSFVFRLLGGQPPQRQQRYHQNQQQPKRNGEINIDYVPENQKKRRGSKEGDYIDYEELK